MERIKSLLFWLTLQEGWKRTIGAVFLILSLWVNPILKGQQAYLRPDLVETIGGEANYTLLNDPSIYDHPSQWVVRPFSDLDLKFIFSMDSVSSVRGAFDVDYEESDRWTEIESDWSYITFFETIGGKFLRIPFSAPVNWYILQQIIQTRAYKFYTAPRDEAKDKKKQIRGRSLELLGVETGAGRVSLRVRGNVNISGKMVFQDQELTRASFREAQTTHLEFDQRQNLNIEGKIGDRISVFMDQDSEREFDWENNIRIHYTGNEDEIIQKIEAGNISLSLPATKFITFSGSNQGLFGLKSIMKLGPIDVTSIASIEQTRKEKQKFTGGSEISGLVIPDYRYRKNQHFFVDQAFRDGLEIWNDDSTVSKKVPSFYPLVDGKHILFTDGLVISEIEVFKSVGTAVGSGTYYGIAYIDPILDKDNNRWQEGNPEYADEPPVGSNFQRLVRGQDYVVSEDLGYIRLTSPVQNEILAVAYTLSVGGDTTIFRHVGQLTSGVTDTTAIDTIHLKMLKPFTPSPSHPTWPLAFKNVYFLGATNINSEGFKVNILFKNGALGNDERDENGNTFLKLFGLDKYDENSSLISDDLIDFIHVDFRNGELFFPMLHPFEMNTLAPDIYYGEGNTSEELKSILPDSATMYRSLNEKDIRNESQFDIKVEYTNKSSTINLGGFMLVEGSEEVNLNGRRLVKDKDYIIDYFTGTLTFLDTDNTTALDDPTSELEILYEKHELVSFDKKTIIGTRAQMDLGEKSFIGGTALYYNQSVINEKIEVGYEPTRNFIWGLNGKYSADLNFLTQALDKLPLIETTKPSMFSIEGEIAQVLPNPNPVNNRRTGDPRGVAFIDDFEGAKRTTNPSIRFRFWNYSSAPVGMKIRNRANMFWYNPFSQVRTRDIWPNLQTSVRAQNELTDILVLDFTPRDKQIADGVPEDSIWAGITTSFYSSDYNQSESKFFEIWLYGSKGKMTVDLGFISEDQNGNGIFDTEDKPESGLLAGNTTLEDEEDIGLDGCEDEYEDGYGGCLDTTYQAALELGYDVYYSDNPEDFNPEDPNGDNWSHNEKAAERPSKYRWINGTEGNGTADRPLEGARYPDTEDINRDGNFDSKNDYFSVTFDLDPMSYDWEQYMGGETSKGWRLYRIPLNEFSKIQGEKGDITWDTIKFLRITMSGVRDNAVVKIAKIELVGNEWQELGIRFNEDEDYVRNDSVFMVTVVNTEDNIDYEPPKGVQGEYDRINEIRLKEQSLVLRFNDMEPYQEGAAQKNLIELRGDKALSYLTYEYLKMYVYGKNDDEKSPVFGSDVGDVEFIMRFGRAGDFYEIRQPVYEEWDERNNIRINLDFLTSLKDSSAVKLRNSNDIYIATDSTQEYISISDDGADTLRRYYIHGKPALSRIQYFTVGVRNKSPNEKVSGEVWLDELRLSGVRKDAGTAVRFHSTLNLADLGSASINYNQSSADFHVLQKRLGSGRTSEKFRIDGKFNLNKLLPRSWGLAIPLNMSFTDHITTPKYSPGTDVLLSQEDVPDSVLTKSRQVSLSTSFSKTTKSDRWFTKYTLDRFKVNFSGSHGWSSDEQIRERFLKNYAGGTSYNLSFGRDNYWSPLSFMKGIPWLGRKIGDTHLYYTPSSVDLSANVSETLTETTPRVGGESSIKSTYNLGLTRSFKLGYKILENLNTNYNKTMKSDMDRFRARHLEAIKQLKPGIITDVTENMSTTFSPMIFDWFKPSLNYTSNYRWTDRIDDNSDGANITSQVRFSSSVTLNPKTIIETIYTPPTRQKGRRGRRRGRKSESVENDSEKKQKKKEPKNENLLNILKVLHNGAGRVSPISITYSENTTHNVFRVIGTANIPYRFGLTDKLDLEQITSETGSNKFSRSHQRDLSLRSGLSLTRKITTNFSFAENRTNSISGNNVRTKTITRDFFPSGTKGEKGFPFFGWSVRWSGVESWPLFKMISKSASLEHAFSGKETRSWQYDDLQSSKYTASFSPIVGISMTLVKGITFSTRYSRIKTIDNRFGGINSTRVKEDNTISASSNYSHRGGIHIPIFFFKDFNLENTVNFTLTFDYSSSETKERNVDYGKLSPTNWQKGWKVSPRISYSFTKRVTGGVWYEYRENKSKLVGKKIDRDFGFDVNIAIQG